MIDSAHKIGVTVANEKRKTRQDIKSANDAFMTKILKSLSAAVEVRGEAGVYGEVTVKLTQNEGLITQARVLEETILRPAD